MTDDDPARASFVGLNHVVFEVDDVEEALDFYGSLLSFDLRGRSGTKAFLDAGDQFLVLAGTDDASATRDEARHVGLVVDDAAAVERRLEALADEFDRDVEVLDTSGLDFRDPWGNRVQVVEYGEVQFTKADHVLAGMGLADLEKTDDALLELAEKGMAPPDGDRGR